MITGESLGARKSLMRMRIDRSIVYPGTSDTGTQRTSLDSLLGVGRPARGRAVSGMASFLARSRLSGEGQVIVPVPPYQTRQQYVCPSQLVPVPYKAIMGAL